MNVVPNYFFPIGPSFDFPNQLGEFLLILQAAFPCSEHLWTWECLAWPKSPFHVCCKEDRIFPGRLVTVRTGEALLHSILISVLGAFSGATQIQSHIVHPLWPYWITGNESSFQREVYLPPCPLTFCARARHSAFLPGWIHQELCSSLQAKVNLCNSWERTHQQGKS